MIEQINRIATEIMGWHIGVGIYEGYWLGDNNYIRPIKNKKDDYSNPQEKINVFDPYEKAWDIILVLEKMIELGYLYEACSSKLECGTTLHDWGFWHPERDVTKRRHVSRELKYAVCESALLAID